MADRNGTKKRVRYAVVGMGHIAQVAVLPAFANAENSELTALISGDAKKLKELARRHNVPKTYSYEKYDDCLNSGDVDAVYIALPNNMHREYTVRAAAAGVHVLCEKPLAVTEGECADMIGACEEGDVKLMTAYRLHFEEANLRAIEIGQSGKIGELRAFNSTFAMQVKQGNIRVQQDKGGGTLYDIGIYCINAARYLFQDEPVEVTAFTASSGEPRFAQVEEMTSVILRFPKERLATFTCSFGAADIGCYTLLGTKGNLRLDPAYEYAGDLKHYLTIGDETTEKMFPKRDQFGPQLVYFSNCILNDEDPEPSGAEGMVDVQIIEAAYRSAKSGQQPVKLVPFLRDAKRPCMEQEIHRPSVKKPEEIRVESPHS